MEQIHVVETEYFHSKWNTVLLIDCCVTVAKNFPVTTNSMTSIPVSLLCLLTEGTGDILLYCWRKKLKTCVKGQLATKQGNKNTINASPPQLPPQSAAPLQIQQTWFTAALQKQHQYNSGHTMQWPHDLSTTLPELNKLGAMNITRSVVDYS